MAEAWKGPLWKGVKGTDASANCTGNVVLREFGACGGLALVAARLPRPHAAPAPPPAPPHHHDLDWVKLDDAYEVFIHLCL